MPPSHLILCRPLLLLPPIPPSIRVFSNESTPHMRWPNYWSFTFSINPSNEHPRLISFRMDWLDLLQSKGLSRVFSNTTVQKHQFFGVTYLLFLLHPCLELQATTDIFNVSVILPLPDFHKVGITHHLFSLFKVASFTCVCAQL